MPVQARGSEGRGRGGSSGSALLFTSTETVRTIRDGEPCCVKADVDVLGSPSLMVLNMVSVDVKQH